jgi:uncharacterized protein YijF (DUF1287 family)
MPEIAGSNQAGYVKKPRKPRTKPACAGKLAAATLLTAATPPARQSSAKVSDSLGAGDRRPAPAATAATAAKAAKETNPAKAAKETNPAKAANAIRAANLLSRAASNRPAQRPRMSILAASDRRDVALLLMPFLLMAVAIGAMHATRPGPGFGNLIARTEPATQPATGPGARRALTGLPSQLTPALDVPATAAMQPLAQDAFKSLAEVPAPAAAITGIARPPDIAAREPGDARPASAGLVPGDEIANSKPVDLALASPDVTPAPAPPSAVSVAPVPPGSAVPVLTAPETEGQSITSDTQCFPALARPQPTVLLNRRDAPAADPEAFGLDVAQAARAQIHDFVIYNDTYTVMKYPMGDVQPMYGVCTDVIIRAYRSVGIDLQELVHKTRVGSDDTNIAHRRVDTLRRFFTLHGESLAITAFAEDYRPGDIVSYYRPQNRHSRTHIAVVSDRTAPSGRPMIIHNRGWGPQQEDGLFVDEITGHYRFSGMRTAAVSKAPVAAPKPKKETFLQSVRPSAKKVIKASLGAPGAVAAPGAAKAPKVR